MARSRRSKPSRSPSRRKKSGRTRTRKTKARKKARAKKTPVKKRRPNAKKKAAKKPAKKARAKKTPTKKAPAKRSAPDFDEDGVMSEMAIALEVDPDALVVDEDSNTYASPSYTVSTGRPEWRVFENEDTAEAEALAYVEASLRDEPELFNQDWLMSHVDEKALSKWVYDAVMEDEYAREIAEDDPDRFWDEAEQWGIDRPGDADDERSHGPNRGEDVPEEAIEALTEAIAKDRAKDPMDWLSDIYGREDATKKAMEVAGIDIGAAAEDAVRIDGWPHFISRYDGNYATTPGGFVYFREN